jgi:hypothetical protein
LPAGRYLLLTGTIFTYFCFNIQPAFIAVEAGFFYEPNLVYPALLRGLFVSRPAAYDHIIQLGIVP